MIESLLIANRGEIACRIIRTARQMGIRSVAVYSDADANALHVAQADSAVHIGPSSSTKSYLNTDKIIAAAIASGVQAIHPGYGFLSENPEFVEAVEAADLIFIGPSAAAIRAMGLKDAAKSLMEKAGVPVVPGYHGADQSAEVLAAEAEKIGYPVMIKARAGGGGKGMRMVECAADFPQALESAAREGLTAFGDAAVLVEKFISSPRHIEVQVFGDSHGNVVHLFERDCSLQRRHQKVIEEAPAPGMNERTRVAMTTAAVRAAEAINYEGAGTIEFIADGSGGLRDDGFWFMEMNTRLQVEHPVTELVTSIDLVELQIRVASGEALPFAQTDLVLNGHAFEARLYAEDVAAGFLPVTGKLQHVQFVPSVRNDTGVNSGSEISPFYDPMIAKIIASGQTRAEALSKLTNALKSTLIAGTVSNLEFLTALSQQSDFKSGDVDTGLIERNLEMLTEVHPPSTLAKLVAAICLLNIDINASMRGWRLWGDANHLVTLICKEVSEQFRLVLSHDGSISLYDVEQKQQLEQCVISDWSGSRMSVVQKGVRQQVDVVQWCEQSMRCVAVLLDGRTVEYRSADPLDANTNHESNADSVLAPMTGVVRQVDIKPGQRVKNGERLFVMEAMKMEIGVDTPRDGVIKDVFCAVDDAVEGGSMLVSLEQTT